MEIEKERVKQRLRQQLFTLDNRRYLLLGNSPWPQCILCILRPPVLLYFSLLALLAFHNFLEGLLSQKRNPDLRLSGYFEDLRLATFGDSFDQ